MSEFFGGGAAGGGIASISVSTTHATGPGISFETSPTVTFGINGNTITASAAGGGGLTNIRVSAGTTSNLLSAITFADSNGLAWGLNASTLTASYTVPTVTNSSMTVSDAATSGTLARIAFTNLNGITLSLSTGAGGSHTIVGSHNALTSQSNQALSGSNGSFTFQTATFGNLNNFSFYTSNGSLVGSYTVPTVTNSSWTVSDAATSGTVGRLAFTNLNGVTLSLSSGAGGSHTIVGSHNALTSQSTQFLALTLGGNTAGTTTFHASNNASLFLHGGNNITLSGNGSSVTISGGAGGGGFSGGVSTGGNTVGTTGTVGSQIVFAGGNNVTLSQSVNGASATITISAGAGGAGNTLSSYFEGRERLTLLSAPGNGSVSLQIFQPAANYSATMMALPVYQSISSSAVANTYGQVWSIRCMILTNDTLNNRLMSLSSGSTQTTYSVASNTAGQTQLNGSGVRPITVPINVNMTPGQYFIAWNWSTNTSSMGTATTALNRTVSMIGRGVIMSASFAMVSDYSQATAATVDRMFPQGVLSGGASAGIPLTISHSQITMTGASHSQANLAFFMRA